MVAASPEPMSLAVEVEIESMDTAVRRCTQALIDCSATGCFIDIEWVKLNNVPTCPLTKPIPVYNIDGTANDAGAITDIADVILHYENHSEHTQLAVTRLGKQSLILGYNWLRNHNPEINWQTKDVKMSRCPVQCSTCRVEEKCDDMTQAPYSRICRSGPKVSDVYRSSYSKSRRLPTYKKTTTPHTYKLVDFLVSILMHQTVATPGVLGLSRLLPSLPLFPMLLPYL
jgi:hypothetical protein